MNHAHVTTKKNLTLDLVDATLREINTRKFKGIFEVKLSPEAEWWEIVHPIAGFPFRLTVTLESQRKVRLRKSPGDFGSWMQFVFQEELGKKFKGRCSDEGAPRPWDPEPEKYPNLKAWWDDVYLWAFQGKPLKKHEQDYLQSLFDRTVATFPEDLKQFVLP